MPSRTIILSAYRFSSSLPVTLPLSYTYGPPPLTTRLRSESIPISAAATLFGINILCLTVIINGMKEAAIMHPRLI